MSNAGHVLWDVAGQVVEYTVQYDGTGTPSSQSACRLNDFEEEATCFVQFNIQERMDPPIYVYYELEEFYQNHRRYGRSRCAPQLLGEVRR